MNNALENSLLVQAVKANTIRIAPPLIITKKDCDMATELLDKSIAKVAM